MKESLRLKLESLLERHHELAALLSDPEVIADQNRFRQYSVEYARLEPLAQDVEQWQHLLKDRNDAEHMAAEEDDADLRAMAASEVQQIDTHCEALEQRLMVHLIPVDPHDEGNIFLEIRAGTGGDEAALFAGDLLRMYSRYAERRGWQLELLSESEGEHGGYREVVARIAGQGAYSRLKFESGAHRVQRVPETEAQGRIHTSAATVAILPEPDELAPIEIDTTELRVDTFRASGAGGQHVNKTDSAIRITHLPTGMVVECQDERSQHKNRARAMALLQARLNDQAAGAQQAEQAANRRQLVGSGDRSERIRTYNFPQGRVTDHRITLTLYKLNEVLLGDLDAIINPLTQEYQADQLAALGG